MIPVPTHRDSEEGEGREGGGGVSEAVKQLEGDVGEAETEVPRINVEIPRCTAPLGTDLYFVKLPNFLSVETRSREYHYYYTCTYICSTWNHLHTNYFWRLS